MKKIEPIVEPEFCLTQVQFQLTTEQWDNLLLDLGNLGIQNIKVTSKQYLENCERNETHLIAITGDLNFKEFLFPFTAQIDCSGFILYINKPNNDLSIISKLIGKSKNKEIAYNLLINTLNNNYEGRENA